MHILREPRVTLLARQQFLPPEHIHWSSDSEVAGQALAEFAGRLCFDEETEVLTRRGWCRFPELNTADEVLTKHPRSGYAEFQRPLAFHRYSYTGDLFCADGRDICFAVTPEHRQWGRFVSHNGRLGEFQFVRTDEIGTQRFAIDCAADGWTGAYPDAVQLAAAHYEQRLANAVGEYGTRKTTIAAQAVVGRDRIVALAELCAYYATEGSLSRRAGTGQGIVIYGDHVASVVALCRTLELPHSVWRDPRNGVQRVLIGGGIPWRSFFEQECGWGSARKRLPTWVINLPADELRTIWRILVRTDGHVYANGREIVCTTSVELAGQCQEILCKLGFKSSVRQQKQTRGTNYPVFIVSRKTPRPVVLNRRVRLQRRHYTGEVFCLTVPNGTLFVRRHGIPHFSGNCYLSFGPDAGLEGGHKSISGRTSNAEYLENILKVKHGSVLEHAVWSLLLEGISRSLTHELVRHRAGFGFCLSGDTLVYSEHRQGGRRLGAKKRSLRQLYEMTLTPHGRSRLKLLRLRCLDEATGTFTVGRVKQVVASGTKPVFRVELADGKHIDCTREHRFLTAEGWQRLEEIVGGLEVSPGGHALYGRQDAELLVHGTAAYREREWLQRQHCEGAWEPHGAVALLAPRPARGNLRVPRAVRVRSLTYLGEQPTYDLEMEGPHHNFVANGIITHNSQLSQRYVDESEIAFVLPPEIPEDGEAFRVWREACEHALGAYRALLGEMAAAVGDDGPATMRKKRARQAARAVLPNCAETKIVVTGNARAWRHFIEMRGSPSADVEIRRLAVRVLRLLQQEAPALFGDLQIAPQPDGTEVVATPYSKV